MATPALASISKTVLFLVKNSHGNWAIVIWHLFLFNNLSNCKSCSSLPKIHNVSVNKIKIWKALQERNGSKGKVFISAIMLHALRLKSPQACGTWTFFQAFLANCCKIVMSKQLTQLLLVIFCELNTQKFEWIDNNIYLTT